MNCKNTSKKDASGFLEAYKNLDVISRDYILGEVVNSNKSTAYLEALWKAEAFHLNDIDNSCVFHEGRKLYDRWKPLVHFSAYAETNEGQSKEGKKLLKNIVDEIVGMDIKNNLAGKHLIDIMLKLGEPDFIEKHVDFVKKIVQGDEWYFRYFVANLLVGKVIPMLKKDERESLVERLFVEVVLKPVGIPSITEQSRSMCIDPILMDNLISETIPEFLKEHYPKVGMSLCLEALERAWNEPNQNHSYGWFVLMMDPLPDHELGFYVHVFNILKEVFSSEKLNNEDREECLKEIQARLKNELDGMKLGKPILFWEVCVKLVDLHYEALADGFWNVNDYFWGLKKDESKRLLWKMTFDSLLGLVYKHRKHIDESKVQTLLKWMEAADDEITASLLKSLSAYSNDFIDAKARLLVEKKAKAFKEKHNDAFEKACVVFERKVSIGPVITRKVGLDAEAKQEEVRKAIEDQSIERVCQYLKSLDSKNFDLKAEVDGALRENVQKEPSKYLKSIEALRTFPMEWIARIVMGFLQFLDGENKPDFDWNLLVKLVGKVANATPDHGELLSHLGAIICKICSNNAIPLSEESFDLIKQTLVRMNDLVFTSDNFGLSSEDLFYWAVVEFSIRKLRNPRKSNSNSDSNSKWDANMKTIFDNRLQKRKVSVAKDERVPFWSALGRFYPNLRYLDETWVDDNHHLIFPTGDAPGEVEKWKSAFREYIEAGNTNKKDYNGKLKSHYIRAFDINDDELMRRVVSVTCKGYCLGFDDLDKGSILRSALEKAHSLSEVVFSFSFLGKEYGKSKVKPLWKLVHDQIKANKDDKEEGKEYKNIARRVVEWVGLLERGTLDEEMVDWSKSLLEWSGERWNPDRLVESLLPHMEMGLVKQTMFCGVILEADVKSARKLPHYKKPALRKAIDFLCKSEHEENERIAASIRKALEDMEGGEAFVKEVF